MTTRNLLLLAVLVSACSAGAVIEPRSGRLEVSADRTSYTRGDTIHVTVRNTSAETLYYGGCGFLENESGATIGPGVVCVDGPLRGFAAGTSTSARWVISPTTPPGVYVWVLDWAERSNGEPLPKADRVTEPFTIQ